MDYKEALSYLDGLSRFGSRPGLTTIQYLLYTIGNPERSLKIIHVAGTNGKGSTSSLIAKGLESLGYKVGLYTSPHLFSIRERIKINDKKITRESFSCLVTKILPYVEKVANKEGCFHPTFFETLTAMAFWYFAENKVDFLVLETGMGGRFDATNVTYPLISVITHIARDHTNFLGSEIEKIAEEKCGIIKGGIPVISAKQEKNVKEIIEKFANYKGSPVYFSDNKIFDINLSIDNTTFLYRDLENNSHKVELPLIGCYQAENAATAIHTIEVLNKHWDYNISISRFIKGLKKVNWPGRFQIIRKNPYIILDGAHNVDGVKRLVENIKILFPERKLTLLIGVLRDKEYDKIVEIFSPIAKKVITTTPKSDRALSPYALKEIFEKYGIADVIVIPPPLDAISYALEHLRETDILLVAGSLYLIGQIEEYFLKNEKK